MAAVELPIWFDHGLGDCVHMAHVLAAYAALGFAPKVHFEPNKEFVFRAAGCEYRELHDTPHHLFGHPPDFGRFEGPQQWAGNKIFHNLNRPPLPEVIDKAAMWDAVCKVRIRGEDYISNAARQKAASFLRGLPRPVVLFHSHGTSAAASKSLDSRVCTDFYREYLDSTGGSLVLLDWDLRVPRVGDARVRHLRLDWGHVSLDELAALYTQSDLLLGVDSGPLHFARLFEIPTVGIWREHHPTQCTLPGENAVHMVSSQRREFWRGRRLPWQLVEYPGVISGEGIAKVARLFLSGPKLLPPDAARAKDVFLQVLVSSTAPSHGTAGSDRGRALLTALRHATRRSADPVIVEVGRVPSADGRAFGYSTFVFAAYLRLLGAGELHIVEAPPDGVDAAAQELAGQCEHITSHAVRALDFLESFPKQIDLLSLGTAASNCSDPSAGVVAGLDAAAHAIHDRSLVIIHAAAGAPCGTAGNQTPMLQEMLRRGWRVIDAAEAVVLGRKSAEV